MTVDSISFDRAVPYYDMTRGFPPGLERTATRLFLEAAPLAQDARVLEIGVGTGRIALPLTEQAELVYLGVDISTAMMAHMASKPGADRVHATQADATVLPCATGTFRAVVACHVFHLIPRWRDALTEVQRVLEPGGVLLHGWGQRIAEADVEAVWARATGNERMNVDWYSGETSPFLLEAGWTPASARLTLTYDEPRRPQEYIDGLKQRMWSRMWRMSDDEIAVGIEAVETYLRENNIDPNVPRMRRQIFGVQAFSPPAE